VARTQGMDSRRRSAAAMAARQRYGGGGAEVVIMVAATVLRPSWKRQEVNQDLAVAEGRRWCQFGQDGPAACAVAIY
jgi:hypothetical protein